MTGVMGGQGSAAVTWQNPFAESVEVSFPQPHRAKPPLRLESVVCREAWVLMSGVGCGLAAQAVARQPET